MIMSISSIMMLFFVMSIAALVPGISALTVSARSASFGFIHGVFTTIGIILGDIIFIFVVVFGLSVIAEELGVLFQVIKVFGGIYLIYLGVMLFRSKNKLVMAGKGIETESSLWSSFFSGLLITLADQKAILFYLGFLPAFVDLDTLSWIDTGIIILTATLAISTKLIYAFLADRGSQFFENARIMGIINKFAGGLLAGVGVFLLARV